MTKFRAGLGATACGALLVVAGCGGGGETGPSGGGGGGGGQQGDLEAFCEMIAQDAASDPGQLQDLADVAPDAVRKDVELLIAADEGGADAPSKSELSDAEDRISDFESESCKKGGGEQGGGGGKQAD